MTAPQYQAGRCIARTLDLIALLAKAPRTRPELVELTGMDAETVGAWVIGLQSEGLIEPAGRRRTPGTRRGRPPLVYRWIEGNERSTSA
jgi:hypothetical protein